MAILVIFSGGSVLHAGEEQAPGIGHDLITAVGKPTNSIADSLPFQQVSHKLTSPLNPNQNLDNGGQFKTGALALQGGRIPPITPEAFDPVEIGSKPPPKQQLDTLLVTGDSLSQPLDTQLAQRLAPDGVEVVRDSHPGTGISNPDPGRLGAALQGAGLRDHHPDAVVAFIGANEGYPLPGPGGKSLPCCGPQWAAVFANRLRQMMDTYRQGGAARVYWLTVPTPRDSYRQTVEKAGQRRDPGRRPALDGPDPDRRHGADLHPRRALPRRDRHRRRARRSSASPTASISTTPAPASPPTRSCGASIRTSSTEPASVDSA